ncbi:MAG: PilN domain-containing protein [Vicinamibacterales bacterium]
MIRINLLGGERQVKKAVASSWAAGQKLTIGCSLILVAALSLVGWRYWILRQESRRLDTAIAQAQAETARMHSIIEQVQQFEQRRTQLQQRVALIEQLRRDQTGPVHMLDQIGRALPPMVWLTRLQQGDDANDVTIEGRGTSLTGLSDFVSNLELSGYFRRSIEIVSSQSTPLQDGRGEVIQFSIRAQFQQPSSAPVETAAPATPAAAQPNSAQ